MTATYRLPDWLGRHAVEILAEHEDGTCAVRTVEDIDDMRRVVSIRRYELVEVRPPSISDPAPWPLEIDDDLTDACLYLHDVEGGVQLRLRGRKEHLRDERGGYITLTLELVPSQVRTVAQALWQREERALPSDTNRDGPYPYPGDAIAERLPTGGWAMKTDTWVPDAHLPEHAPTEPPQTRCRARISVWTCTEQQEIGHGEWHIAANSNRRAVAVWRSFSGGAS